MFPAVHTLACDGDVGEAMTCSRCRATSAASSLALLMYWPSYQYRAGT